MKCFKIMKYGQSSVLEEEEFSLKAPQNNEALIRHEGVSLERYDSEHRSGVRHAPRLPCVLGVSGFGIVEKISPTRSDLYTIKEGDRVIYCTAPFGSYSTHRIIDSKFLIRISPHTTVAPKLFCATLFKAMTAHFLVNRTFRVKPNDFLLVHCVDGCIGMLLAQWCLMKGANVIGTVDSPNKLSTFAAGSCIDVLNYKDQDFVDRVLKLTKGKGCKAVFDPLGASVAKISMLSLGLFGVYISYGQITGQIQFTPEILESRSLSVVAESLYHHKGKRFPLAMTAAEVSALLEAKKLTCPKGKEYQFSKLRQAHEDFDTRSISGFNIISFS